MVDSTDEAGIVTGYVYDMVSGSGQRVTQTRPAGVSGAPTEITRYYKDGRIRSISGTGVVKRAYKYDAGNTSNAGWQSTTVLTGTDDPSASSWPRWTRTTNDMLGRVTTEERPAYPSGTLTITNHYDSVGRLIRVETPDRADTLYAYNTLGDVEQTALDLDMDGAIDLSGPDRVTETVTRYAQYGSQYWRETTTAVYVDGSSTPEVTGSQRERLTGYSYSAAGCDSRIVESRDGRDTPNVTTTTTYVERDDKTVIVTTDRPDSSSNAISTTINGLLQSSSDAAGVTTTFAYDGFGRRRDVETDRGGITRTNYSATTGQVTSVQQKTGESGGNPVWATTGYAYYASNTPSAGRVKSIENALGRFTYFDYDALGRTIRTWGDVPQPVEIGYNSTYGERVSLKTFRSGSGWDGESWPSTTGAADETTWTYHAATGLQTTKTYADDSDVAYTYKADGRLATRVWARGITTTYSYDIDSDGTLEDEPGELGKIEYSDCGSPCVTPPISFTYKRFGGLSTVADAAGCHRAG